jgi:hypothetical protein
MIVSAFTSPRIPPTTIRRPEVTPDRSFERELCAPVAGSAPDDVANTVRATYPARYLGIVANGGRVLYYGAGCPHPPAHRQLSFPNIGGTRVLVMTPPKLDGFTSLALDESGCG